MTNAKTYTLGNLAELLQVELIGDAECEIKGLATLKNATEGELAFLSNPAYIGQLPNSKASAVILSSDFVDACKGFKLVSDAPYLTYAKASQLFDDKTPSTPSIHATAVVAESADIAEDVTIGANSVVDANVSVGAGSIIGSGCFLGQEATIGKNCHLYSNVSIYHRAAIGDRVIIHSGAVIGADGFGYASDGEKSIKIAQLGSVSIGDDVEIGAGTTIDRGALDDTVIEEGVKIDNQVQIGHNCIVGAQSIICGCTAIAGSAVIGKYCVMGGASGMVGHISIADGVKVSAMSLVSKSIDKAGTYSSGTGIMETAKWKKNIVRFAQLDDLWRRFRKQEKNQNN